MKKIINYIFIFLLINMSFMMNVYAGSYSVSLTSNSVIVGNSVTLKITGSEIAGKFSIVSSNSNVASLSSSTVWIDNSTESITISTKSAGSTTITITPIDVADYSGNDITGGKTLTLTVNNKPVYNTPTKVLSSNNFLSSLSVEGLTLDKDFDKETLEYSVTCEANTEKIKINAQLGDSSASVTGVGEQSVTTGNNTINIEVTAENGSKRTYVLTVIVKELDPINVKVSSKDYTVVRKREELPKISEYFKEVEVEINNEKVPGYENTNLDIIVVGLKDTSGNINYYIYEKDKYTLYKEYSFNGLVLEVLDKEIENGYIKTNFIYDNEKIDSYQEVKMDIIKNTYALDNNEITGNQFYLFYAKNVETGEESLYQYDALEKTVQRYNTLVLDMYKENSNTYYMYLLIGILSLGLLLVLFSIILMKKSKKMKKLEKENKKLKKEKDKDNEMDEDF